MDIENLMKKSDVPTKNNCQKTIQNNNDCMIGMKVEDTYIDDDHNCDSIVADIVKANERKN